MMNNLIATHLQAVHTRITEAEKSYDRPLGSVSLLAVSKKQPITAIEQALALGHTAFGENYLQEAIAKIMAIKDKNVEWHFIGPIQSNKTRAISEHFNWVHTIDRLPIATRLSKQRPKDKPPLNVCIQVNISNEATKSGIQVDEIEALAHVIQPLPGLKLRGLMAIPAATKSTQQQRHAFKMLRLALDSLNTQGFQLDTLSMGMSKDLEMAIAEGATIVRVGTDIFGPRKEV